MYAQFFHLRENPFSIAPDPRYLYMSRRHQEALAHLLYGVGESGGFIALTGEVGTGKTTLCRCLLEQLPKDVDIALILNPRLNAAELLASLCDELRIPYPAGTLSLKVLVDALNGYLLDAHARGRRTVVMIDEAQNLSFDVLEQIRLLTNLETPQTKLLQVILVGQPELNRILERKELRQLRQRITARYFLPPLSLEETADYIRHRLAVSGGDGLFTRSAVRCIYHSSSGIPRLINIICDRALLGAYAGNQRKVIRRIARKAAAEVMTPFPAHAAKRAAFAATATLLAGAAAAGIYYYRTADDIAPQTRLPPALVETVEAPAGNTLPQTETPRILQAGETPPSAAAIDIEVAAPKTGETPVETPSREPFETVIQNSPLSFDAALGRLLKTWNADEAGLPLTCEAVQNKGLKCLPLQSTWNELRNLNRPAVLEFSLAGGERRYVALIGLEEGKPVVELGGKREIYSLEELLPSWKGYYALLWRPPAANAGFLAEGSLSPAVRVLRERLAAAGEETAAASNPDYFDQALKKRVTDFQRSRGLVQDGVAGPKTFIYLDNAAKTPNIPKLETTGE